MSWWGKIVGGAFGMMLGGPIGAMLGATIGHNFDKGLNHSGGHSQSAFDGQERMQTVFYTSTFSIMGYVCKADGQVTQNEISLAEQIMRQMDINAAQRKIAIQLFDEGKKDAFPFTEVMQQLKQEIGSRQNLRRMFLEIQIMAAYADDIMHPAEYEILLTICQMLGISQAELDQLCAMIRDMGDHSSTGKKEGIPLKQAYTILGIDETANANEIKKAYRRLINQHHPDKLVAKGLPEEMMKVATQRTSEISKAYEIIKVKKGFK